MLEGAGPEPVLDEGEAIGLLDRFALQHRVPNGKTVLDQFLASWPDLTAADREMARGWRDPYRRAQRLAPRRPSVRHHSRACPGRAASARASTASTCVSPSLPAEIPEIISNQLEQLGTAFQRDLNPRDIRQHPVKVMGILRSACEDRRPQRGIPITLICCPVAAPAGTWAERMIIMSISYEKTARAPAPSGAPSRASPSNSHRSARPPSAAPAVPSSPPHHAPAPERRHARRTRPTAATPTTALRSST